MSNQTTTRKSIWDEWKEQQLQQKKLPFPDYFQAVLAQHGMHVKRACKGCIHLSSRVIAPDSRDVTGVLKAGYHGTREIRVCTAHGQADQEWQETWPACDDHSKWLPEAQKAQPEQKKKWRAK